MEREKARIAPFFTSYSLAVEGDDRKTEIPPLA